MIVWWLADCTVIGLASRSTFFFSAPRAPLPLLLFSFVFFDSLHPFRYQTHTTLCDGWRNCRYKDAVYFAGPYSTTARHNLTILASDDNGGRFDRSLLLWPSNAGYTGLQCGIPGDHDCAVVFDGNGGECASLSSNLPSLLSNLF